MRYLRSHFILICWFVRFVSVQFFFFIFFFWWFCLWPKMRSVSIFVHKPVEVVRLWFVRLWFVKSTFLYVIDDGRWWHIWWHALNVYANLSSAWCQMTIFQIHISNRMQTSFIQYDYWFMQQQQQQQQKKKLNLIANCWVKCFFFFLFLIFLLLFYWPNFDVATNTHYNEIEKD